MSKQLILALERTLELKGCNDAVTKVIGLQGVFNVISKTQHSYRIILEDHAVPDTVIAAVKQVPGVRHVEKPIPHYPC